jgi:Lrp/AsnC family transcriptional regulator, leucine-responsive regulatory protein
MFKLDLVDKKILYYLDLNARETSSKLAKRLRLSKQTVNFRINRLTKNKIIKGYYALLNNSLLGMFFTKIFIKLEELNPTRKEEILNYFSTIGGVGQVLLMEGKYDVQLFFLGRNNQDVSEMLEKIYTFCGRDIKEKEIMFVDELYKFNLKTFYSQKENYKMILPSNQKNYNLDPLSFKILQKIVNNARIPILQIARELGISAQLAQYHVKKLIRDKFILGFSISLNYGLVNRYPYHLAFEVNDHKVIPKLVTLFQHNKNCIFATKKNGKYDCSVEIIVENNDQLRLFVSEIMAQFSDQINELDVMLIYKEYKLELFPI